MNIKATLDNVIHSLTHTRCKKCCRDLPNRVISKNIFNYGICTDCESDYFEEAAKTVRQNESQKMQDSAKAAFLELLGDPEFVDQLQWRLALTEESKTDTR